MSLASTPRTWVIGELVTAAVMNTEVRDALTGIQAAWDSASWVPAAGWTAATTNPAIGNGTSAGYFTRVGKTVNFAGRIVPGSTTTFGAGAYSFTLPATPVGVVMTIGTAMLFTGAAIYHGAALRNGGGMDLYFHGAASRMSPTVPVTFANGHTLYFQGSYQAA